MAAFADPVEAAAAGAPAVWNGAENWDLLDDPHRRAMWVWADVRSNADGRQDLLLDFAANKSISDLYVYGSAYEWSQASLSQGVLPNESFWIDFNAKAHDRGVRVWLLYYLYDDVDDPRLLTDDGGILAYTSAVHAFNTEHPESAFAGIQSDQEPNDPATYPGLLANMRAAREYALEHEITFATSQALRPKWRNQLVTFEGVTKPMNEHVMDLLDHTVLMAYNDNVNTVRSWANQAVGYATSIGKQVAIGFETDNIVGAWPGSALETWWDEIDAEPDATRFLVDQDSTPVTFEDAINTTTTEQGGKPGYDRQAIHNYDAYFQHWFGQTPESYIAALGGFYDTSATAPARADLSQDANNYAPILYDDHATTPASESIIIDVLENDFDIEGAPLAVVSVVDGSGGVAAILPDGRVRYTPDTGYSGVDEFQYTVSDGRDERTARVRLTVENAADFDGDGNVNRDDVVVWQSGFGIGDGGDADGDGDTDGFDFLMLQRAFTGANGAPIAEDDAVGTGVGQPVGVDVLANDTDPDGDALSITSFTQPANGGVIQGAGGTLIYTPDPGFAGTDTFSYEIDDGNGGAAMATATVTVAEVGLNNAGFETGTTAGWTPSQASATASVAQAGGHAAQLGTGTSSQGSLTQTIVGLSPNTRYRVTAWFASSNEADTFLNVSGHGAPAVQSYSYVGTAWRLVTLEFTTAASATQATVRLSANPYNQAVLGPSGYPTSVAYVDEVEITSLGAAPAVSVDPDDSLVDAAFATM